MTFQEATGAAESRTLTVAVPAAAAVTGLTGASGVYLSGGFGIWEIAYAMVATPVVYRALQSYRYIAVAWLMYLVSSEDKMIPPDAQRAMSKRAGATVVEARGSHAIYESKPAVVASLIEKAAMAKN